MTHDEHGPAATPGDEHLDPRGQIDRVVRTMVDRLSLTCVEILLGGTPGPTTSYLGGSPYLPPGSDWPVDDHGPQLFVGQVSWAEVPARGEGAPGLQEMGFPRSGMLQWFVSADDTWGLSFDDDQGATGFTVRWFDDLPAPGRLDPHTPPVTGPDADHPLELAGPVAMGFRVGRSAPLWADLLPVVRQQDFWPVWAQLHGRAPEEVEDLFDDFSRRPENLPGDHVPGSKIGGYPTFTQADPRGTAAYAPANQGPGFLLLELDGDDTGGWGDGGIAQLFGDPEEVAVGDLRQVRYHWDCF